MIRPAIALAATLWGTTERLVLRLVVVGAGATAFSLLTPLVRATHALDPLPDWIEWYLRPPAGRSWFALFPWAAARLGERTAARPKATREIPRRRAARA